MALRIINIKVPHWLKPGLTMTEGMYQRLKKQTTSWRMLSPVLRTLNELDCMRIVCIELEGSCRPEIISRPLKRLNKLRTAREMAELMNMYPLAGVRHGRRV